MRCSTSCSKSREQEVCSFEYNGIDGYRCQVLECCHPYRCDLTAVKSGRLLLYRARPGRPGQALVAALAERSFRHTGTAMRGFASELRVFWRSPGPASSTSRIPAPASRPSGDDPSRERPVMESSTWNRDVWSYVSAFRRSSISPMDDRISSKAGASPKIMVRVLS